MTIIFQKTYLSQIKKDYVAFVKFQSDLLVLNYNGILYFAKTNKIDTDDIYLLSDSSVFSILNDLRFFPKYYKLQFFLDRLYEIYKTNNPEELFDRTTILDIVLEQR